MRASPGTAPVETTAATGAGAVDVAKGPRPLLTEGRDATRPLRVALERVRPRVGGQRGAQGLTMLCATEPPKGHRQVKAWPGLCRVGPQGATPCQAPLAPPPRARQAERGPPQGHAATLALRLLPTRALGFAKVDAVASVAQGATSVGPVLPRGPREGAPRVLLIGALDERPIEGVTAIDDVPS